ncbi:MAG: VOC family protein [Parachlamydiaceae bacterium]|nr:VOC family protein [Parachlamydiaceae bacterium]
MTVKGMHLSWIVVSDLKKAKKFFTESVGLQIAEAHDEMGWIELKGKEGGSILGIAQATDQEPIKAGSNAVVTLTVDNLEQACSQFAKSGVRLVGTIQEIPGHVKMQLFEDLDGNKFQLVQIL